METIEISGGTHITDACVEAVAEAKRRGAAVRFNFNDTDVIAQPDSEPTALADKWHTDFTAKQQTYLASDEYKQREAKRAEEDRQKRAATMVEAAQSESEMRDAKVPWPHTKAQLAQYIESLVNRRRCNSAGAGDGGCMSEWQPIETAPKDGTEILAFGMAVKGFPRMMWDTNEPRVPAFLVISWLEGWYDKEEEVSPGLYKKVRTMSYSYWKPDPQQFKPTHWMPLPAAPIGGHNA